MPSLDDELDNNNASLMEESDSPEETNPLPEDANPVAPEKKTSASSDEDELLLSEDDSIVDEDEGGVLQRVLWAAIKIVLSAGFLFFVLWVLWFSDKGNPFASFSLPKIFSPAHSTTTTQPLLHLPASQAEIFASESVLWAQRIEQYRQVSTNDTLSQCLFWLRRARAFFDIPLNNIPWGTTPQDRSNNVRIFLSRIKNVINESAQLRLSLSGEIAFLSSKASFDTDRAKAYELILSSALAGLNPPAVQEALRQKTLIQKNIPEYSNRYTAYRYVLQAMEGYDRSLRVIYENVYANQKALIQNIQVVDFPSDPLERVLTPAEWRSKVGK